MTTFSSSVWDKLIEPALTPAGQLQPMRLTLEQYQRVIARDLESLLNTRIATPAEALASYPACRDSIVNFGLADFAQLCLSTAEDRKAICDGLTAAIIRHEPRLRHVRAQLVSEAGAINRLSFAISALLCAPSDEGRVRFGVRLEPSSLHYFIR